MVQRVKRSVSRSILLALVAVIGVLGALAVVGVQHFRPSDPAPAGPVAFEALGAPPQEPFTPSSVTADVGRLGMVGSLPRSSGSSDDEVLYVVDDGKQLCDVDKLVATLSDDPARLAAWSSATGVAVTDAERTIRSWNVFSLRNDTVVVNHRFSGGRAVPYRAVLQAGTVVLVDEFGVPRTKCACGNPLGIVEDSDPIPATNDAWSGFDPAAVVTVRPSRQPRGTITAVDLTNRRTQQVPVGGNVSLPGVAVATRDGVVVIDPKTGTRTTIIDRPAQRLAEDGRGGLFFTYLSTAEGSGDAVASAPASPEARSIWYLAPGAAKPAVVIEDTSDETRWFRLLGAGTLGGELAVAYSPLTAQDRPEGGYVAAGPLRIRNVATGVDRQVLDVAFGHETGTFSVAIDNDRLAMQTGSVESTWRVFDAQLNPVANACDSPGSGISDLNWCSNSGAVTGGEMVITRRSGDGQSGRRDALDEFNLFSGAKVAERDLTDVPSGLAVVDATDELVLLADVDELAEPEVVSSVGFINRSTGAFTAVQPPGSATLLRTPLLRPVGSISEAGPAFDPLNTTIPASVCRPDDPGRVTVRNGSGLVGTSEQGDFVVTLDSPVPLDVDADGSAETVVIVQCSYGGSAAFTSVAALHPSPDGGAELVGPLLEGQYGPGGREPTELAVVDPTRPVVRVSGGEWLANDPAAGGSGTFAADWMWGPGEWTPVG